MAFKTFSPGVLTSSDVNTFLMRQSVITCTAATRPASPNEGMTVYETDTDLFRVYSGSAWEVLAAYGAWTSFTPVLTNWVLGNATHDCAFTRLGRVVIAYYNIAFGTTSTFSGGCEINLPITAANNPSASSVDTLAIGSGYMRDVSLGNPHPAVALHITPGRFTINSMDVPSGVAPIPVRIAAASGTLPFTWTNQDMLSASIVYEAAA